MKDRAPEGNLPWRSDERVINNIQQPENPWVFHPAEWTFCPAKRRAAPCPVTKTVNFYWSEPVRSLSFSINYSANTHATLIPWLKDSIPGPTVIAKQMYFYIKSTCYVCWFPPLPCNLLSDFQPVSCIHYQESQLFWNWQVPDSVWSHLHLGRGTQLEG